METVYNVNISRLGGDYIVSIWARLGGVYTGNIRGGFEGKSIGSITGRSRGV
jgi:hypothetical protein